MTWLRSLFRRQDQGLPLSWHFLLVSTWAFAVISLVILFSSTPIVIEVAR